MFGWIPYAFVRIVLFFCAGILLAINFPSVLPDGLAIRLFLILCATYAIAACIRPRLSFWSGLVAMCAICLGGFLNVRFKTEASQDDHLCRLNESFSSYKAVVAAPAQEKQNSWKTEALVQAVHTSHGWVRCHARILLYLPKEYFKQSFSYGDVLLIAGMPKAVSPPMNMGEFDYQKYLAYKQIYHQHFVRNSHVELITHEPSNAVLQAASAARVWADDALKQAIPGSQEAALASALVLGVTDALDNDVINAYAATGAMHVLSVSGLHVGIVYLLLTMLLKPFDRFKWGKWLLFSMGLTVLWVYAFITGICASVLRAVIMFSFAVIAKPWNQATNIYNILAASAFCILLYDPFMIMSVGFQLSYLAVLGIVSMQPRIYQLWEPSHRVWDEIWKVASVSIAAQLATVSLGLYYFHQFPNYFLLTNLFVIPGSFVVLVLGICLLLANFLEPITQLLGWLSHWIIKLLNTVVFSIEQFPFSVVGNIWITTFQCWTGILFVAVIVCWFDSKNSTWMMTAAALCIAFVAAGWLHFQKDINANKLSVYAVRGCTAIDLISNGRTFFIGDTSLRDDDVKTKFHMLPNRLMSGATRVESRLPVEKAFKGCSLIVWKSKTLLRIVNAKFALPRLLNVDLVIISNNAVSSIDQVAQQVHAAQYVVDGSNSPRASTSLTEEGSRLHLNVFSVMHSGAFNLTF
ncbi:MAG TPA: ComEC/Rec2 family competence protein [Chryseolinea sp.]|nr:ComEC/Rec2 family competence protein [Chryseolinea sp.]